MQHISTKAGWITLGIFVGLGTSLLLGANQPAVETSDRYDVDLDMMSIGGAVLTAHDREENRMLIYQISGDEEAELKGVIDLNGLGQETLSITGIDTGIDKPDEEENSQE